MFSGHNTWPKDRRLSRGFRFLSRKSWFLGIGVFFSCQRPPAPPPWWVYNAAGVARESLLGGVSDSLPLKEKLPPYYADSFGYVFRLMPPEGGVLWVEYYAPHARKVTSLTYTWEQEDFSKIAELYQRLRAYYANKYGQAGGVTGENHWLTPDSVKIELRLSPEKKYLHAALVSLRTFAP